MKVKQGSRFKMTNKGKTYSVLVTYVNYGLYILDFYYDGEFRTSKAVDKQFFKDNDSNITWMKEQSSRES